MDLLLHPREEEARRRVDLIAAELGYLDPARRILNEIAEDGFKLPLDAMYSTTLGYLAEVAAAVEETSHAPRLYSLLADYGDMTITAGVTTVCTGAAARRLGVLASTLGDWELAEDHFETALAIDEKMRAPPWKAYSQYEFARMLLRRGKQNDLTRINGLIRDARQTAVRFDMRALLTKLDAAGR